MKIDMHCHSYYSFDAFSSPKDLIKSALKKGLDGIALCDHDTAAGWEEAEKAAKELNAVFIKGEEIKTNKGDILGLFLNKEINGKGKDPFWVIGEIKKQGGVAIIPHPYHYPEHFKDDLIKYIGTIDAIEIFNSRRPFSSPDKKAFEFAKKHNLGMSAGSDAHCKWPCGDAYVFSQAKNLEEFKQILLNKENEVFGKKSSLFCLFFILLSKLGISRKH